MWRGGLGSASAVAGSFDCRCRTTASMPRFHTPLIEPCRRISRTRLSDKTLQSSGHVGWWTAGAVRASGTSEALRGSYRLTPISGPSVPWSLGPELRLLPSAGITRPRRYYGPLRHPTRPGLSLAGVRLTVTRRHREGLPVLLRVSVCRHAVASPTVDSLGQIARGPAYSGRSPVASDDGLPQDIDGSASTT